MKTERQYRAESDARKRAKGLYKPSIWVHTTWKGTERYERIKKLLEREVGK